MKKMLKRNVMRANQSKSASQLPFSSSARVGDALKRKRADPSEAKVSSSAVPYQSLTPNRMSASPSASSAQSTKRKRKRDDSDEEVQKRNTKRDAPFVIAAPTFTAPMNPEIAEALAKRSNLTASFMDALGSKVAKPDQPHEARKKRRRVDTAPPKRNRRSKEPAASVNMFAALADSDSEEERQNAEREEKKKLDAIKDMFAPATFAPPTAPDPLAGTTPDDKHPLIAPATFKIADTNVSDDDL